MKKILSLLISIVFVLALPSRVRAVVPTPVGSTTIAVDPSGNFSYLHLDISGALILSPTAGMLTGPSPLGSIAVAVDPSGNFAYLNVDSTGALITTGGSSTGTVTHTGALTATNVVVGNGTADIKVTGATIDGSNNFSTSGTITAGAGGSTAGQFLLPSGSDPGSAVANNIMDYAPTSVTGYKHRRIGASGTGFYFGTDTTGDVVDTQVAANGSGNVLLSLGTLSIASGKTLTISNSYTTTATDGSSIAFGAGGTVLYNGGALGTPASGTATNLSGTAAGLTAGNATLAANLSGTPALPNGTTATTQTTGDTTAKIATNLYVASNNYLTQTPLTYNSTTMAIDFAGDPVKTVAVSGGNITFTTAGKAVGKWVVVIVTGDGSTRNYTLPAWIPIGNALPTTLAAGKVGVFSLYSTSTTDGLVLCNYNVQP